MAIDWQEEVVFEGHVSRPGEYLVRGEVHRGGLAIVERLLSGDPAASILGSAAFLLTD